VDDVITTSFAPIFLKIKTMTVYQYIAENNPDAAYELCKQYGYYDINDFPQLAQCLEVIVGQNGEEGLSRVMELHPDKDTLLELFKKKQDDIVEVTIPTTAPIIQQTAPPTSEPYTQLSSQQKNADGSSILVNQTNLFILGGAILITFAIIISRNHSKS